MIPSTRAALRTGIVSVVALVAAFAQASLLSEDAVAKTASTRVVVSEKISHEETVRGLHSSSPVTLSAEGRSFLGYAPAKIERAPRSVVYLHGAHGRADKGCPWMRPGASEVGWLVCPEAPNAEPMGLASWGDNVAEQAVFVNRAIVAAHAQGASTEPGVAVGFSQGAYVTIDIIKTGRARFVGLVLLGAQMHPDVQRLRAAGVVRVALGAGQQDAAFASLKEETVRLAKEGIETRFVDLGAVGHTYAADDATALREAIVWAGGST